jgi:hypothetical protein
MRFEHQIKLARFGQVFATAIWALLDSLFLDELVEPQMHLARSAIDHRIGKSLDVS